MPIAAGRRAPLASAGAARDPNGGSYARACVTVPAPSSRELALRLLQRTSSGSEPLEDPTALAATVLGQLHDGMAPWIGREGVRALVGRAVAVAQKNHPVLARITISDGNSLCLEGIASTPSDGEREAYREALIAVITNFIDLLGRFLGENLTSSIVERHWSTSTSTDASKSDDGSADHDA